MWLGCGTQEVMRLSLSRVMAQSGWRCEHDIVTLQSEGQLDAEAPAE